MKTYPTLIHERVALAQRGENETVICQLKSGWVVLGDNQFLRGYTLLLADPIFETLNHAPPDIRAQFLQDMTHIGDALLKVLSPSIINYSILGNLDRALHAHIHPRYDSEPDNTRNRNPYIYTIQNAGPVPFDKKRDHLLIQELRSEIASRTTILQ